ncbi:MAG: translation initiation factor eIF-1A [Nanoarchaeota archaeon]|nr:translation initiation factor eIF-1A [Nanoarchaeota archaeon]
MSIAERMAEEAAQKAADEISRVKLPRGREVIGILEARLGGSRMKVRCFDNKTRICRIPGRLKKRLWVRDGDTVLVEPWQLGGDEKGDVVYVYTRNQVGWLKRRGLVKEVQAAEEF